MQSECSRKQSQQSGALSKNPTRRKPKRNNLT